MTKGLETLKQIQRGQYGTLEEFNKKLYIIEKEIKALKIIVSIFDIKILGDYLIAQRGDTCVVENLKLRQSQEIINLLKEVLL